MVKVGLGRVREWLVEPTPRYAMLPAYVILAIFAFAGLRWNDLLAQERLDDARTEVAERDYQQCINRAETRESLREIFLGITALFPDSAAARDIELLIEVEYPPLEATDCVEILGVVGQ